MAYVFSLPYLSCTSVSDKISNSDHCCLLLYFLLSQTFCIKKKSHIQNLNFCRSKFKRQLFLTSTDQNDRTIQSWTCTWDLLPLGGWVVPNNDDNNDHDDTCMTTHHTAFNLARPKNKRKVSNDERDPSTFLRLQEQLLKGKCPQYKCTVFFCFPHHLVIMWAS